MGGCWDFAAVPEYHAERHVLSWADIQHCRATNTIQLMAGEARDPTARCGRRFDKTRHFGSLWSGLSP
jgi:hypothetical protein